MNRLLRLAAAIDAVNRAIGRASAWLILACVLISAATATLRYLLDWGSNSLLEIQWFLFGLVFLLCAAWTLLEGGHVRIDILYSRVPPRAQLWIDIAGGLFFLLPMSLLIAYDAWGYFLISFQQNETSPNPGGLPWWPMKLLIPVAFVLLAAQGASEIVQAAASLVGARPIPVRRGGH